MPRMYRVVVSDTVQVEPPYAHHIRRPSTTLVYTPGYGKFTAMNGYLTTGVEPRRMYCTMFSGILIVQSVRLPRECTRTRQGAERRIGFGLRRRCEHSPIGWSARDN